MSLKAFMYSIALFIFLFSNSFVGGVESAFGFLFWCHLVILIPIIVLWFALQVFGFSLALSPVLAGFVGGSAIMLGGWLLLFYFGINTALAMYISNSVLDINAPFGLPIGSWVAVFLYVSFNLFAPSLKTKFFKQQPMPPRDRYSNAQSNTHSEDVVIDAEWSEVDSGVRHGHIEHKDTK